MKMNVIVKFITKFIHYSIYICNIIYIFDKINFSPSPRSKKNAEKHYTPIKISDLYNIRSKTSLLLCTASSNGSTRSSQLSLVKSPVPSTEISLKGVHTAPGVDEPLRKEIDMRTALQKIRSRAGS